MPPSVIDTFDSQQDGIKKMLKWVFENVGPYIKGRVLEMSSGEFTIASLIQQQHHTAAMEEKYKTTAETLYHTYDSKLLKKTTQNIDLAELNFNTLYFDKLGTYDTVIAIGVISQGFYKKRELDNARQLLRNRGRLIVIVPSLVIALQGVDLENEYLMKENYKVLKQYFTDCDILLAKFFTLKNNPYCFPFSDIGVATLTIVRKL